MPIEGSLEARIRTRLAALQSRQLLRTPRPPSGIDLSSNDYLNLSKDPRVTDAFIRGAQREGCGSTGSRLLRGERDSFIAIEEEFAQFKGSGRSLFFSSGYLANLAVLGALPEEGDVIFADERNHASLIDGAKLSRAHRVVCPHSDLDSLARLLTETPCPGLRFVVVESVYSMDGDIAPLGAYAALCRSTGAVLIVDEAHAVGIYGDRGTGVIEAAAIPGDTVISINTAGKALGAAGAFVAGPSWAIEYLIQRARTFIFSTAPTPALADALHASLTIVGDEPERRERLLARSARLRRRLRAAGIDTPDGLSQIVPVMIGGNQRALDIAHAIQSAGFDVRAIRPPSVPRGTARLRLSVNADLPEATIDRFVDTLSGIVSTTGAAMPGSGVVRKM